MDGIYLRTTRSVYDGRWNMDDVWKRTKDYFGGRSNAPSSSSSSPSTTTTSASTTTTKPTTKPSSLRPPTPSWTTTNTTTAGTNSQQIPTTTNTTTQAITSTKRFSWGRISDWRGWWSQGTMSSEQTTTSTSSQYQAPPRLPQPLTHYRYQRVMNWMQDKLFDSYRGVIDAMRHSQERTRERIRVSVWNGIHSMKQSLWRTVITPRTYLEQMTGRHVDKIRTVSSTMNRSVREQWTRFSRTVFWWSLAAVAVYGVSTTFTREAFRYAVATDTSPSTTTNTLPPLEDGGSGNQQSGAFKRFLQWWWKK